MASREEMRDLAERITCQGSELSRLGAQIIRSGGLTEQFGVKERIKKELMYLAVEVQGLRVDRNPLNRETEFYWKDDPLPFLVMSDDELKEWGDTGSGAVKLKVEDELLKYTKEKE